MKADELIAEHFKLDDWLTAENKRYEAHVEKVKKRIQEIKQQLLELLNAQGGKAIKTDHGTASTSTITTPGIADRDQYLDFIEQNWEAHGNAMLQLSAPQITAVKEYMDSHNGLLPPGVKSSSFTRVNIRRG